MIKYAVQAGKERPCRIMVVLLILVVYILYLNVDVTKAKPFAANRRSGFYSSNIFMERFNGLVACG